MANEKTRRSSKSADHDTISVYRDVEFYYHARFYFAESCVFSCSIGEKTHNENAGKANRWTQRHTKPFYQPRGEVLAERGTWERFFCDLPEKPRQFCCLRFHLIHYPGVQNKFMWNCKTVLRRGVVLKKRCGNVVSTPNKKEDCTK